jgi:hypothetical protein
MRIISPSVLPRACLAKAVAPTFRNARLSETVWQTLRCLAVESIHSENCDFAIYVLNKELEKLQRELPASDRRIGSTLRAIGHSYYLTGKFDLAYNYYQKYMLGQISFGISYLR